MRKGRIAVEMNLISLREYLDQQGYEVVQLDPLSTSGVELHNCEAVVISGMDKNMLGMQDVHTGAPVIDATGKSPEQILNQLKSSLQTK